MCEALVSWHPKQAIHLVTLHSLFMIHEFQVTIDQLAVVKIKMDPFVTSEHSKNQKWLLNAPSHILRKIMSFPLSKELRQKYNVCSIPIWKDDEGLYIQDHYKGQKIGSPGTVYRKTYAIYI